MTPEACDNRYQSIRESMRVNPFVLFLLGCLMTGFNVLVSDGAEGSGRDRAVPLDDRRVLPGGVMRVRPVSPSPTVVPEKDPEVTGPVPVLREGVRGKHPRLLFTAADVAALREKSKHPALKPFLDQLNRYVPSCMSLPVEKAFLTDDTDGIRQGCWRMPTLGMHYLLTGDPESLKAIKGHLQLLMELDHWQEGNERDSGMGAANIMMGAALAFDWSYNDLDPEFRELFRKKLLYQARAMYHGGHLMKNRDHHYWQNDPGNNHRWHRDAGLATAVLAAYEGNPEEQWILTKMAGEMNMIATWLPKDGSCHDGSTYLAFGTFYLVMGMQATDHCLGTTHLQHPFFRNVAAFATQVLVPGLTGTPMPLGDCGGMAGWNTEYVYALTGLYRQADLQAAQLRMLLQGKQTKQMFLYGWFGLLWLDPTLEGDFRKVPCVALFPDVGVAIVREGWAAGDASAMFKCGPLGGVGLNHFRNSKTPRGYINVAHDDHDANSFVLYREGFLAESDRYSKTKMSQNLNTILVNNQGQSAPGRSPVPIVYTQPAAPEFDMLDMAYLTAWKEAGDVVVVEGEAAACYRGQLERFRRHLIWVRRGYVLVIDDVRAVKPSKITWLMQGPKLTAVNADEGRYALAHDKAECPFTVLTFAGADAKTSSVIGVSPADDRGKLLHWQQLQMNLEPVKQCRFVSVYDVWGRAVEVSVKQGADQLEITVTGKGVGDIWRWTAAKGARVPAGLTGTCNSVVVDVTASDVPPVE